MAFLAFGSLLCSVLFVTVPDRAVFALVACGVLVVLALLAPGLLATDRSRTPVDGDLVALLRRTTIFAPLPPFAIEQIVSSLTAFHPTEGTVIYEQGATGDSMVIIGGGSVGVLRDGARIDRSTAGDYVGEVALLDDKPRNATVVAGAGCTLYVLPRDVFLEAVTGHPRSLQRARAGAARRQRVPDVPDVAE